MCRRRSSSELTENLSRLVNRLVGNSGLVTCHAPHLPLRMAAAEQATAGTETSNHVIDERKALTLSAPEKSRLFGKIEEVIGPETGLPSRTA